MKDHRDRCFVLARKAARILIDLGWSMEGKWDRAPQGLLDNIVKFERYVSIAYLLVTHELNRDIARCSLYETLWMAS